MADNPRYFVIAGERSGDLYASHLVAQLKKDSPSSVFMGYGGRYLRDVGVTILRDYNSFSNFGISSVLSRFRFYWRLLNTCTQEIADQDIHCVLLVDFSGFNLRLAKQLHSKVKVVYFIAPKLWAWGSWRIRIIKKRVDLLLVIFPFEFDYFRSLGFSSVQYIGNPTKWLIRFEEGNRAYNPQLKVGILPGSRNQEILSHLPILVELMKACPDYQFVVIGADNVDPIYYEGFKRHNNVTITFDPIDEALKSADVAIVASGTATLEVALMNIPQVVIYRTNTVTYLVARFLVRIQYISLVNILLDRPLVRELIQEDCTQDQLLNALEALIKKESTKKISEGYSEILGILGNQNPFKEGSKAILNLMQP